MRPIVVLIGLGLASFGGWKFVHRDTMAPPPSVVALSAVPDAGPMVVQAPAPEASTPAPKSSGFIGVILAGDSVLVEPNVGGRIEEIFVKAGDQIVKGQKIAQLDVRSAKHELESAQVSLTEAVRRLSRRNRLVSGGLQAITPEELDTARFDVARERAKFATLSRQVSDATVLAPFSGTVTEQYLVKGALAGPGKPIVRMLGKSPPRVRFAVPEDKSALLVPNAKLAITSPTSDRRAVAALVAKTPEVDNTSGMIYATALVDMAGNTDPQFANGGLIVRVFADK